MPEDTSDLGGKAIKYSWNTGFKVAQIQVHKIIDERLGSPAEQLYEVIENA